jgi:hypothetical protein
LSLDFFWYANFHFVYFSWFLSAANLSILSHNLNDLF